MAARAPKRPKSDLAYALVHRTGLGQLIRTQQCWIASTWDHGTRRGSCREAVEPTVQIQGSNGEKARMMAGKAENSSAGQTGPMARRPAAGRSRPTAGQPERASIPIDIGAAAEPIVPQALATSPVAPISPDVVPRLLQTKAAYRLLITSGFSGQDAAGLISYVVGLPRCDSRWSLGQVNRLLFLRALYTNSEWGEAERRPA
jgi:hypothetical protein